MKPPWRALVVLDTSNAKRRKKASPREETRVSTVTAWDTSHYTKEKLLFEGGTSRNMTAANAWGSLGGGCAVDNARSMPAKSVDQIITSLTLH